MIWYSEIDETYTVVIAGIGVADFFTEQGALDYLAAMEA